MQTRLTQVYIQAYHEAQSGADQMKDFVDLEIEVN